MAEVRVGMSAPAGATPSARRAALAAIADAGIDHVLVGDHVSFFVGVGFDGLIESASLLSLHDTLPVYVGVYLLPLRHPVLVARQLADLAQLGPGRLTLGVGVGGEDRHEVEVCGVDPATRGRRMDESMTIVRRLLAGERVDHHGRFFDLEGALIRPAPAQPVPLVVGGRSDAAVRRAARLGDGWLGIWVSPRRFTSVLGQIDDEAGAADRGDIEWQHGMQVWCGFGATPEEARPRLASAMQGIYQLPFETFERYSPYGRPEQVAAFLAPYVEAGCRSFNLITRGTDAESTVAAVAELRKLLN